MFKNQNLEKNKNMFWNILGPNLTGQSPLKGRCSQCSPRLILSKMFHPSLHTGLVSCSWTCGDCTSFSSIKPLNQHTHSNWTKQLCCQTLQSTAADPSFTSAANSCQWHYLTSVLPHPRTPWIPQAADWQWYTPLTSVAVRGSGNFAGRRIEEETTEKGTPKTNI